MKRFGLLNFSFFQTWIKASLRKIDFTREKDRYIAFISLCLTALLLLSVFSARFFLQTKQLEEMVLTLHKSNERKQCSTERKKKLEELSKKHPMSAFLHKLSSEVQSVHYKKELKMITQFQGFELLKGHESKIVFSGPSEGTWKFNKNVYATLEGFQECEYTLQEPLQMSDEELKVFLAFLEGSEQERPSLFIKHLSFEKRKTPDNKEIYETKFTLVVREKIQANSSSRI